MDNNRTVDPYEQIANFINNALLFLEQLKSAQTTGADNLAIKVNQSANTYDKSVSINNGDYGSMTLNFTANNQDYAFTDLNLQYFIDGSPVSPNNSFVYINQKISTNPRVTSWIIELPNYEIDGLSHTYSVKALIGSTDTGVIS